MRFLQSSFFRAVCAIVVGVLLIKYRQETVTWITICIGGLFLLSGIIALVEYYYAKRNASEVDVYDADGNLIVRRNPTFPIVGVGSIILGLILALTPHMFVDTLMYVLAAMLILGALNQYANLIGARKYAHIPGGFWIFPSLILIAGIVIVLRPQWVASMPLVIIGSFMILYGVTECVNALKIHSERRKIERQSQAEENATAEEPESIPYADDGQGDGSFGS